MRPNTPASICFGLALAAVQASAWASGKAPAPASSPTTAPVTASAPAAAPPGAVSGVAATDVDEAKLLAEINPHGFVFPVGLYRCDLDRSVDVREVARDMRSAIVRWNKKDYVLRAVAARTGALRYEDPSSGLVWLVIVGKSMLLDTKLGKQLANDCRV
jgi:hypothetical protein